MAFDLMAEVEELRKRGANLGLNDEEINQAILKSLGEESTAIQDEKLPRSRPASVVRSICFSLSATFVFVLALLLAFIILSSTNKQFGMAAGKALADYQYPIIRLCRFMALPFHKVFNLEAAYKWECIINNPEYEPSGPDCEICEKALRVPTRASLRLPQEDFKKKYYSPGFSVIIANVTGYGDVNHTYEELIDFYHKNKDIIDSDSCEIYAFQGENKTGIGKVLENWKHYEPLGNILSWKMCYGHGFRAIRKLYPRPYFVHSEGALDKTLSLLQPRGETPTEFAMPSGSFENIWVAQVDGSSTITLTPVEDCGKCSTFEIQLDKGNVCKYLYRDTE